MGQNWDIFPKNFDSTTTKKLIFPKMFLPEFELKTKHPKRDKTRALNTSRKIVQM